MAQDVSVTLKFDSKNAETALNKLSTGVKGFEKNSTSAFSKASDTFKIFAGNIAAIGVAKAIGAISGAISSATDNFLEFDKSVAEVNSILPENQKLTEENTETFLGLAAAYGTGAAEQAKSFYQVISAGITDTKEAFNALEVANKAATAGLTSTQTAIDVLTSLFNVYGRSGETIESISDKLFRTVQLGKTTFEQLAGSIGRLAPIAKSAGIGLGDLAGTVAQLTKGGISTEEAVTAARAAIQSLQVPTEAVKKQLTDLGVEFGSAAIKSKGFDGVLRDIIVATKGNADVMGELFPNVRAQVAAVSLATGGWGDYQNTLKQVNDAMGATDAAFEIVQKSASKQFDILKAKIEVLGIQIFKLVEGPIVAIVKNLGDFVSWVSKLGINLEKLGKIFDQNEKTIKNYALAFGIVITATSLLTAWMYKAAIAQAVQTASITAYIIATNAATVATTAFNVVTKLTPWGLAIAAVAALTVGIGWLINNWKEAVNWISIFKDNLLLGFIIPLEAALGVAKQIASVFGGEAASAIEEYETKIKALKTSIEDNIVASKEEIEQIREASIVKNEIADEDLAKETERKQKAALADKLKSIALKESNKKRNEELKREQKLKDDAEKKRVKDHFDFLKAINSINSTFEKNEADAKSLNDKLRLNEDYQYLVAHLGKKAAANALFRAKELIEEGKHEGAIKVLQTARVKAGEEHQKGLDTVIIGGITRREATEVWGGKAIIAFDSFVNNRRVKGIMDTNNRLTQLQTARWKEMRAIGKAAAIIQIGMDTAKGAVSAYAAMAWIPLCGPALGIAAAAALITFGGMQAAKVAGLFQQGGIVPGANFAGDQLLARVNSGEMVLNRQQQAQLFDVANGTDRGSGISGGGSIEDLTDAIMTQPIIIEVDGVELGKAVRGATQSGFALEGIT